MMWDFPIRKGGPENGIYQRMLDISGHRIKLYWMDTALLTGAAFDRAYQILPPWRREKADFYLKASDKRMSVGAGLLLQRALADAGVTGPDTAVAFGQYGKPYLPEHPGIHFSLSHGGNLAVAVLGDTHVGCDVEQVGQADMALAEKFFCPGEYAHLAAQQEGGPRNMAFYRLWTLKESFIKATGLGLGGLPLDRFEITLLPDGTATIRQQVDTAAYGFWGQCSEGMCLGVCLRVSCNSSHLK